MLIPEQIAMLNAAAKVEGRLDLILDAACMMEDYDTANYIVDNMLDKLKPDHVAELRRDGVIPPLM